MPSLIDMKKKRVIVGSYIIAVFGLLFFMEATAVIGIHNSTDNNCISIECLKEKLKRICKEGSAPPYLDCENILHCINAGEQEIMRECIRGYPADNESRSCNSQDLLYRSWCDYIRGAVPR